MLRQNITDDSEYTAWFYKKLTSILEDELTELFDRFNETGLLRHERWYFSSISYYPATRFECAHIKCTFEMLIFQDFKYNLNIYPTIEKIVEAIIFDLFIALLARLYPALRIPRDPPSSQADQNYKDELESQILNTRNIKITLPTKSSTIYDDMQICMDPEKFNLQLFKLLRRNRLALYEVEAFAKTTVSLPCSLDYPFKLDKHVVKEKLFNEDVIIPPRELTFHHDFVYLSGDDPNLGSNLVAHRIRRNSVVCAHRFFVPHEVKKPHFRFYTSDNDHGPVAEVEHLRPDPHLRKLILDKADKNPNRSTSTTKRTSAANKEAPKADLPKLNRSI